MGGGMGMAGGIGIGVGAGKPHEDPLSPDDRPAT
jgi:hypothetical protein